MVTTGLTLLRHQREKNMFTIKKRRLQRRQLRGRRLTMLVPLLQSKESHNPGSTKLLVLLRVTRRLLIIPDEQCFIMRLGAVSGF